jgi:hypothetical protein
VISFKKTKRPLYLHSRLHRKKCVTEKGKQLVRRKLQSGILRISADDHRLGVGLTSGTTNKGAPRRVIDTNSLPHQLYLVASVMCQIDTRLTTKMHTEYLLIEGSIGALL